MGIISGLGSFRGQFGDHFRVGDHFGVGIISGAVQISGNPSNYLPRMLLFIVIMYLIIEYFMISAL